MSKSFKSDIDFKALLKGSKYEYTESKKGHGTELTKANEKLGGSILERLNYNKETSQIELYLGKPSEGDKYNLEQGRIRDFLRKKVQEEGYKSDNSPLRLLHDYAKDQVYLEGGNIYDNDELMKSVARFLNLYAENIKSIAIKPVVLDAKQKELVDFINNKHEELKKKNREKKVAGVKGGFGGVLEKAQDFLKNLAKFGKKK